MKFKYREDYRPDISFREKFSKMSLEELEEIIKREEEKIRKRRAAKAAKKEQHS